MIKRKAFLNGKEITRKVRDIKPYKDNSPIFKEIYSIKIITSEKCEPFVINGLSEGENIPNLLYIEYYDKEEMIDRDSYSFVTEDVSIEKYDKHIEINIEFSKKNEILEYVNKIEELADRIQELETENDELKQKLVNLFNSAISGGCFHGDL